MTFPPHKCGLFLTHNEHKNYYETVEEFLTNHDDVTFESEAARQRCVDTDEYWGMQWYPQTPIRSYCIAAPTLDELLAFAQAVACTHAQAQLHIDPEVVREMRLGLGLHGGDERMDTAIRKQLLDCGGDKGAALAILQALMPQRNVRR